MEAEKYIQKPNFVADELKTQVQTIKPLLVAVFAGLFLLLLSLRVMPPDSTPLLAKVLGLHNPKVSGSSPLAATNSNQILASRSGSGSFRFCRNSVAIVSAYRASAFTARLLPWSVALMYLALVAI